jgi:flagellar hook-associated protein 3
MRVTNKMLTNELRRNLNTNMMRLDEFQRQLSTTKKLNRPSDNPAALVKALRLRTSLNEGEQYLSNINESVSFLETTDAALYNVGEIMQRARELAVKAATGSNDPDAHNAIAKEIRELNDQLKIIANTTYGSKHVFAGTNVTEAPYNNGRWRGNQDFLEVEVGVGVTTPINVPQMKEFFMGRLELHNRIAAASGISNITAHNLKEGEYKLSTELGTFANSTAIESQSYLHAVAKNKSFFYQDMQNSATLGAGTVVGTTDASYSGSLAIEVKRVDHAPHFFVQPGSNQSGMTFAVDQPLYRKDATGNLIPLSDGDDLTGNFNYVGTGVVNSITHNISVNGETIITFDISGPPQATAGDNFILNNDFGGPGLGKLYNAEGQEYIPATATFNGVSGEWDYHGVSTITADIKGHIYTRDGEHKEINLYDIEFNMEAGAGDAIFTVSAADINDSDFTDDLVIWNASANALGGIDARTPQLVAGDKTIIAFSASNAAVNAEKIDIGYGFKNIDGQQIGRGSHSFTFDPTTIDNQIKDLSFYTLDQETGVLQDGTLSLQTNTLGTAPAAAEFTYTAGLFGFMDDLIGKIEVGKLPQVGDQLEGKDIRMQELLYHRSTIGARINRLELQESRLIYSQESLTDLLSKNEDADLAQITMELKMQENVYRAALAAGARIIMPTLVDFLR